MPLPPQARETFHLGRYQRCPARGNTLRKPAFPFAFPLLNRSRGADYSGEVLVRVGQDMAVHLFLAPAHSGAQELERALSACTYGLTRAALTIARRCVPRGFAARADGGTPAVSRLTCRLCGAAADAWESCAKRCLAHGTPAQVVLESRQWSLTDSSWRRMR